MTEIYLDNQRVWPVEGASFKLSAENPYFTKTSSYTAEVELPLAVEDNRKVFGWINRMDVPKSQMRMPCRMVVDNAEVLVGESIITKITQNSVKVQLLGANALYNYGNKADYLYIDQLDLGVFARFDRNSDWEMPSSLNDDRYGNNDSPYVMYPAYNSSAGKYVNIISYMRRNNAKSMRFSYDYTFDSEGNALWGERSTTEKLDSFISFQPYFWWLCKIIAQASGYDLANEDNHLYNNALFKRIFYVHGSNAAKIASVLPHWTVNEFWTEIENMFGVVVEIDYSNKTMKLTSRKTYFADCGIECVGSVADEYDAEIDDDSETDISSSNVGYADHEAGLEDELSDYIKAHAEYDYSKDANADLADWGSEQGTALMKNNRNIVWCLKDGHRYIYSNAEERFVEVDMLRPRIMSETPEELDIELRIVPAKFAKYEMPYFSSTSNGAGGITTYKLLGYANATVLEVEGISDLSGTDEIGENMVIEDIISGEEEEESDSGSSEVPDVMYAAISNYGNADVLAGEGDISGETFSYPRALLRERRHLSLSNVLSKEDSPVSLSLIPFDDQTNMASEAIGNEQIVAVQHKYCIKFVSDTIPRVKSVFLIRNKRYVCEKIEATIKPSGLDKLLTGYFYEIY